MKSLWRSRPSLGCNAEKWKLVWVRSPADGHPVVPVPHLCHAVQSTPGGGLPGPPQDLQRMVSCTA